MCDAQLHLQSLSRPRLAAVVESWGFAPTHVVRLWRYLYRELAVDFAAMSELPRRLRERLGAEAAIVPPTVVATHESDGGATSKYLFELGAAAAANARVETVLMRYATRATACLSSQAGCALGCVFCATGQAGFSRNLTTAEIVGQAIYAERILRSEDSQLAEARRPRRRALLGNLVFMGMGEPLLNYDAVATAIEILADSAGMSIGGKQTTVSTVGVVPGIVRLADEGRPWSLAVSLHAANQGERAAIVPAARAWPLDELIESCRYYATKLDRKIFFEWTLIAGKNDGPEQARELIHLLADLPAQVNLIPLNATSGYDGAATDTDSARRFQAWLRDAGLPTTIRTRRGLEVAGGCGQLAASG